MYFFCLQADRPLTGGLISGGGGGRTFIQGGLVTGCMFFCLPIDGPITGGEGLQVGGALISRGGLVIGCIFCLQVDGTITGGLVSGGGEGAYIREACNQ